MIASLLYNGRGSLAHRVYPAEQASCVNRTPRSPRACPRSPEKRKKKTPVLQATSGHALLSRAGQQQKIVEQVPVHRGTQRIVSANYLLRFS